MKETELIYNQKFYKATSEYNSESCVEKTHDDR